MRMQHFIFQFLALAWVAGAALAQELPVVDEGELRELCLRGECRFDVVTSVRLADGQVQEERITQHRPAILANSLSIMLGEELQAVADFDNNQFIRWRAAERREPSRNAVLDFKLTQTESDGSISLEVRNNGREPVKLNLFTRAPGAAGAEYTSSCPVIAGGSVYEYWSRPVVEVIVGEAVLVTDDGALQCN